MVLKHQHTMYMLFVCEGHFKPFSNCIWDTAFKVYFKVYSDKQPMSEIDLLSQSSQDQYSKVFPLSDLVLALWSREKRTRLVWNETVNFGV